MSSALIRRASPSDLQAAAALGAEVVRLHHRANPKRFFLPEDPEKGYVWWLAKELARPQAVVLVAELDGTIVGYSYGTLEEPNWGILAEHHAVIQDLCVVPAVRHRGIGRHESPRVIVYWFYPGESSLSDVARTGDSSPFKPS